MESKELTIQGINFNISTEIFDLLFLQMEYIRIVNVLIKFQIS